MKKFLDQVGLEIYHNNNKKILDGIHENLDTYVLDVDYSDIEFDTSLIAGGTTAVMGVATMGTMRLGNN